MNPTIKGMDAVPSGSGVFYQAMPAVGTDGKNIMKLIPVQIVNGQFVQTQTSQPKPDPTPPKAVTLNTTQKPVQMIKSTSLNPSAPQQGSLMNALLNQIGNSRNKRPLQQQTANLMTKVPLMATPAANCEKSVRFPSQLPVTVKSPSLPSGQYIQIAPNAEVRTVSASDFPPAIKKQIFDSLAKSSPGPGNVVHVSPITTVNQGVSPQSDPASHLLKVLSKMANRTSGGPPPKALKRQLKLIPKVSQRPNSPIRWMIEEEDSSPARTLDPLVPSVTSEILQAAAQRENADKHSNVITKPVSQPSQEKSRQGQENALVMCNGKVFLLARKSGSPLKIGKGDSQTAATKSSEFNKTTAPSSQQSPETRQNLTITIPDEDEVIDLCEDDDSSQQAASVNASADPHLDEDNVIFVSYVPPQNQSGSVQNCQQSTSTKQLESMDVDVETGSQAVPSTSGSSSGISSQIRKDAHKMESYMNAAALQICQPSPNSCQMADHALRQTFGITADVKICLPRIDDLHIHVRPLKCSHFKLNVETEPAIRYVEPIDDEDFLCTHENDIHSSEDRDWRPQTKICVESNTNTRRIGRTRKRTVCPCCVPGSSVVKSSAKSAEPEKWAWTTEQTSRKGGRRKAVREDVKTTAKNKQNCQTSEAPASDSLSTTSMDSDELKQHEEVKTLKELLREKEAALEQMRDSMS